MSKSNLTHLFAITLLLAFFSSCKKETITRVQPSDPFSTAGTNQSDVSEFSVKLNADSLQTGQGGKWTIVSGLQEQYKVYFDDDTRPDTRFHGMPGENYVLKWKVGNNSESTVKISFKPLTATIINAAPNNQTQFYLTATSYDSGQWTIEGDNYASLQNQSFGGTVIPDINAPNIKFQAYAHKNYKLTWTTKYGSKSVSASITLNAGDYLESEALHDLQIDEGSNRVTYESGHITSLDLSSEGTTWLFADTVANPALQALTYLKKLDLSGSATFEFPKIIGDRFKNLEYLDLNYTILHGVPENIGQLKKLKQLNIEFLNDGGYIGNLPETFGQLENLEILNLAASGIQRLPDSFGQLKKLRRLDIGANNVKYVPESLGNCSNLQFIDIVTQSSISGSISKLSKLRFLRWISTASSSSLPADIGNMASLDTLDLEANIPDLPASFAKLPIRSLRITGSGLPALSDNFGDLANLEDFTLAGSLTVLPASFTRLSKLKYCILSSTGLTSLPADIGNLKKLQYLDCSFTKLTVLPPGIGDLSALTDLKLGQCRISTLPANFYNLQNIKTIDLGNNQLSSLSSDFQKLKNTLSTLYLWANNYPPEDLIKIKQLLPKTLVYPY
ncbi:leucine-rich repeat domain-containing protein [Mucilaginibacter sp. Mucisp86]|uniref:leucine-rich repeat domain-containing protein n=1 Tax=Mucilaginibacter sp. Mucisp86 TaxID=3243060 RepID=UPI0039B38F80